MDGTVATIEKLFEAYAAHRPSEIPTLRTILKTIVLPHLGYRKINARRLDEIIRSTPAQHLYRLLAPDCSEWVATLSQRLPQGASYQKTYPRAIKRLIAHGESLGLMHPDEHAISPEWGTLSVLLLPLTETLPAHRKSSLRCGFKRLARWATSNGLRPGEIPIQRDGERIMEGFRDDFDRDLDSPFYQARLAWNLVVDAHPEKNLRPWDHDSASRCRGIPYDDWPSSLRAGFLRIFRKDRFGMWSDATKEGYRSALEVYLGVLRDRGIDFHPILSHLDDGMDALRLLFQGMPPGYSPTDAEMHAESLLDDREYRDTLLHAMRSMEGVYEGRACKPNPFVEEAAQVMVDLGKITSAHNLYAKAMALNRGILGLVERHADWCKRGRTSLALRSKRSPADYTLKKRVCFRHPLLWEHLVSARSRLREHTHALEEASKGALGEKAERIRDRWAVALRNEVYFNLMLCYPLRVGNYAGMQLDRHYEPASHRIYFGPCEAKNGKEIDYELPSSGSLGDVRDLVDSYLEEARPILLAGRASPYFFVPNRLGGTRIPVRGFNIILAMISRRFLSDVLPPGLSILNPHMLRHVTATYHLAVRRDVTLAAQMLNDSPLTIYRCYADVLENKKDSTRRFLTTLAL